MTIYSPVTKSTTEVIRPWYVSEEYDRQSLRINPGIDLSCKSVYSICTGCVIYIGQDTTAINRYSVLVQYDTTHFFMYSNLVDTSVNLNDIISLGQLIGSADRFVHFEALQLDYSNPQLRVMIYEKTYYKIDPTSYADGSISLFPKSNLDRFSPW